MKQFKGRVLQNRQIALECYSLQFSWANPSEIPLPGQFVTIRNSQSTDPLLRRPFAVSSFDTADSTASLIYQLRGKATAELSSKRVGEQIDVLGPLGNGFPGFDAPGFDARGSEEPGAVEPGTTVRARYILVAGGTGIGPILYLADGLATKSFPVTLIVGARDKERLPDIKPSTGVSYVQCTEDGSFGFEGTSVGYLDSLADDVLKDSVICACGPDGMLEACDRKARANGIQCWVSMEQVMGCGVGACMGCAVRIRGKKRYARVCTEGPVFDSREIVWK